MIMKDGDELIKQMETNKRYRYWAVQLGQSVIYQDSYLDLMLYCIEVRN